MGEKKPVTVPLVGSPVTGTGGADLGRVAGLILDPGDGSPQWLLVDTPTRSRVMVPAAAVSTAGDGALITPFDAATLDRAPLSVSAAVSRDLIRSAQHYYGLTE